MSGREIAFTEVLELGCTPDEIFWHMIDPKTASTVDPMFVYWRSEEFPPKVGTLNHMKVKGPFGTRMKITSRFAEFDPPHRMVVEGVRPFITRWGRQEHDLEAIPGGMRYTVTWEADPPPGLRLMYRMMSRRIRHGVVEGSRRLVERFGPPRKVES